jgi:hypothetical protein
MATPQCIIILIVGFVFCANQVSGHFRRPNIQFERQQYIVAKCNDLNNIFAEKMAKLLVFLLSQF